MEKNEYTKYRDTYKKEVLQRWGESSAYKEYQQKSSNYSDDNWNSILNQAKSIFEEFADKMSFSPSALEVQNLVAKWQKFITDNFYTCTNEILLSLSSMYVNDERYKDYFSNINPGLADFIAQAIDIYCS